MSHPRQVGCCVCSVEPTEILSVLSGLPFGFPRLEKTSTPYFVDDAQSKLPRIRVEIDLLCSSRSEYRYIVIPRTNKQSEGSISRGLRNCFPSVRESVEVMSLKSLAFYRWVDIP